MHEEAVREFGLFVIALFALPYVVSAAIFPFALLYFVLREKFSHKP